MRFGTLASIGVASNVAEHRRRHRLGGCWEHATGRLVAMMAATAAADATLVWLLCPWLPGLPRRGTGVRPMLAFGGNLTGFSVITYCAGSADRMLIGWYWGAAAVGVYSRAFSLLVLPLGQLLAPVLAVATPAMSRLQNAPQQWADYYLRALRGVTFFTAPLSVFLFVFADDAIALALGPQWQGAVVIFRLLTISALALPLSSFTRVIFTSLGRGRRFFVWGAILSPVVVASILVGLPFGPAGVAACYAVTMVAVTWPCLAYAFAGTCLTPMAAIRVSIPPMAAAAGAGAVAWCVRILAESAFAHHYASLCLAAFCFAAVYFAVVACLPSLRSALVSAFLAFARKECL